MDIRSTEDTAGGATPTSGVPATLDSQGAPEVKLWQAGTLTYTAAGLVILFCWLLWGDFAWSTKERSVSQVVQLLLKRFEASDMLAGLLIGSFPQLIAIAVGPIISYKSDRHRGRWGRRIPYLLIPTPIAVLSMIGLAFSPLLGTQLHNALGAHSPGLNPSILIFFGLFWTFFEFATITANSVFGAFVNDVVPRSLLGRFYGLFRALSLIAGMIFGYWFLGKSEKHYVPIFLGVAAIYGLGFTAMCLKVKEGEYPPPDDIKPDQSAWDSVGNYFRECFSHPYYLWVFAAMTLPNMAFQPINLFNVFYAKSLNMSMDSYGRWMAFYFGLSLLQSYPVGWLVDRFHPLRVALAAVLLHCVASLIGFLVIRNASTFALGFVLTGVLSGTYFTATAALPAALFPKLKFAQFLSAWTIVNCVGTMIVGPVVGRFLDYTGHQYRYTYLAGFLLDALGMTVMLVVFAKFMAMGGPKYYVAPDESAEERERRGFEVEVASDRKIAEE